VARLSGKAALQGIAARILLKTRRSLRLRLIVYTGSLDDDQCRSRYTKLEAYFHFSPCCAGELHVQDIEFVFSYAVVFRDIKQYPGAILVPHVCVVKVDAPIYFANVDWVGERVNKYVERYNNHKELGPVHYVVLDMTPVAFIDTTGVTCFSVRSMIYFCREDMGSILFAAVVYATALPGVVSCVVLLSVASSSVD
jgi:MFS superfamily sulfate permease-like transporter